MLACQLFLETIADRIADIYPKWCNRLISHLLIERNSARLFVAGFHPHAYISLLQGMLFQHLDQSFGNSLPSGFRQDKKSFDFSTAILQRLHGNTTYRTCIEKGNQNQWAMQWARLRHIRVNLQKLLRHLREQMLQYVILPSTRMDDDCVIHQLFFVLIWRMVGNIVVNRLCDR